MPTQIYHLAVIFAAMKYSQQIGVVTALALILTCFMPWTYLPARDITVSGVKAIGTGFGKPGMLNIILALCSIFFFLVPKIWAKRTNVFIAAIGLAWSIRNYLLVTTCYAGECPEKKAGIFLLLLFAIGVQLMAFFPKMDVEE